jgi:hypothetical protein
VAPVGRSFYACGIRERAGTSYTRQKQGFAERLPALVANSDRFSLRGLGRELGVDHAHLSRIVAGRQKASLGLIVAVCRLLGVSPYDMPEVREATVAERIARDAHMRDRLFIEVLNSKEDPESPVPGEAEARRYRPRMSASSSDLM